MKVKDLKNEYDELQKYYGAEELDSIYNGGCEDNPDICFIFMNPTGRNIASSKDWKGRKSPWIGTKNIWKLFYLSGLLKEDTFNKIQSMKPKDWNYEFSDYVYDEIKENKIFITNLGKCTQLDARPLSNEVLKKYLNLLLKELDIVKPKIIITFGNQVSSIILNKKISVSSNRKECHYLKINNNKYKVYPVYYPVGNGIFNMDKAIEDIKWIIENELENIRKQDKNMNKKLFDINYAKNKLNEYLKNDIEAELCIRIKNNKYMIIPLKDKISFQWIGKTNEIYYKNVEELFSSKLINGIILDKDWN